ARREAHPQAPFAPRHLVAVDDVARSLRLHDLDRLQIGSPALLEAGRVVAVEQWYRKDAGIVDPDHLAPVDVDDRRQALDRMGVLVVVRVRAEEHETLHDAAGHPLPATANPRRPPIHAALGRINTPAR